MAQSFITRTQYKHLISVSKHLISTTQSLNYKPFSTTLNPQNSNLSNSLQDTHFRKQVIVANLLQRFGFPHSKIHGFLAKNKSLLNSHVLELEKSMNILSLSFKLHQSLIVSLLFDCPSVLELGFLNKWQVGIASLGSFGSFPKVVSSVLECSRRFHVDPDKFSCFIEVLRGLGCSDPIVGRVLEELPEVVMLGEAEVKRRMDFWIMIGMERRSVDRVYNCFPRVLGYGVQSRLRPLVNEFLDMGFDSHVVREEIAKEPRILGLELGELRWCLEFLRRLRCRESIKEEILSKGPFQAGFAVKLRVDCLCGYGLIRRDALNVLKREPRSIIYDIKDIERKMEFLLESMKFCVDSLIEVPEYLGVNFDKQIVPRYNVIEYLRSRGGLGFELGLRDIIKPSRLTFFNLYVKPYPECEKMYGRYSDYVEIKKRHPTGLWKHFKPPKYPESKEDVKNMKSFTELLV